MPDDLAQRVTRCIAETQRLAPETVTLDSTFEELGIDSLDGINILFALETEFGIDIPDADAREVRSIQQMVDGVRKLVTAGGAREAAPGS
jgi:acyl carrier protein